ncbi:MAG: transcriptional repressor [Candidatus Cloacimonetes bacterium]|nr:transcriptional repressor [Candidatus Cloacimonadota bacterium]
MHLTEKQIKGRLDDFQQAAREAGIKVTHQRLSIYRLLTTSENHPSAEEIYAKLKKKMPTVSLDTVYRTLWMLADLGFINTVSQDRGSIRFDGKTDHHHHFYCIRCRILRDFTNKELSKLKIPKEAKEYGETISLQVEVQGICDKCHKKENKSPINKQKRSKT